MVETPNLKKVLPQQKSLNINFPRGHVEKVDGVEKAVEGFFSYEEALYMGLLGQREMLANEGVYANAKDANEGKKTKYSCITEKEVKDKPVKNNANYDDHPLLCGKMNAASVAGVGKVEYMTRANKDGLFTFVTTRNNNFSNRKQTLSISVGKSTKGKVDNYDAGEAAGIAIGSLVAVGAAAFIVVVVLALVGVITVPFIEKMKKKKSNKSADEQGNSKPLSPKKKTSAV